MHKCLVSFIGKGPTNFQNQTTPSKFKIFQDIIRKTTVGMEQSNYQKRQHFYS